MRKCNARKRAKKSVKNRQKKQKSKLKKLEKSIDKIVESLAEFICIGNSTWLFWWKRLFKKITRLEIGWLKNRYL